ncbi:MAG: Membrane protein of unknown function [Elusimicrobia bacterium ADurb.Bin231]|nr:MAG: Membrane protein of unknown function [Elusimicrobia bacterium ADurb.Bin231]
MKNLIVKWCVNIIALSVVVYLVPGIYIERWQTAIAAGILLAFLNTFLKPILLFLTLPFNILTLGLFTLIVNGIIFFLVSKLVSGFTLASFWNAVLGSIFFSIVSFFLNIMVMPSRPNVVRRYDTDDIDERKYKDVIDVEAKDEN